MASTSDGAAPPGLGHTPITIIGAGAIGGTVGAYLHDAGYAVTLVDLDRNHVAAISERGLRISGLRGDRYFPVPAVVPDDLTAPLGVTFLCVKGHFTDGAMRQYAGRLAPEGYIVSLQNGLNEAVIASYVGPARTVGAFVHFGADYLSPGHIRLGTEQTIQVGELDGTRTARAEAIRATLAHVMPTCVTTNIWGYLWGKLVYGAMAFTVSTVDAPVPEVVADDLGRKLCRLAAEEAYLVAKHGADTLETIGDFNPNAFAPGPEQEQRGDAALRAMAGGMRASVKQHMGIWRDLAIKKRRTEVDMQSSVIVAKGKELHLPTPVNAAVVQVIHEIESGWRGMDWSNLHDIANAAGVAM